MSNVVLAALGTTVTLIAFAAFSVVQLAKTEAQAGRRTPPVPEPVAGPPEEGRPGAP